VAVVSKPALPVTGLVIECHEKRTGVWAVHFTDSYGEQVRTYHTVSIAAGVARRYEREGRTVHGVHSYNAQEVEDAVVATGRGHRWAPDA
jgi:hypothetical protein